MSHGIQDKRLKDKMENQTKNGFWFDSNLPRGYTAERCAVLSALHWPQRQWVGLGRVGLGRVGLACVWSSVSLSLTANLVYGLVGVFQGLPRD